jgi:hypothetical protein
MKPKSKSKSRRTLPMKTAKGHAKPTRKYKSRPATIEQNYLQNFTPLTLPHQGLYTEEDSLEQPSELKDIPSTTVPCIEG